MHRNAGPSVRLSSLGYLKELPISRSTGIPKRHAFGTGLIPTEKKQLKLSSPEDERCLLIEKSVVSYGIQLFDTYTTDIFPT